MSETTDLTAWLDGLEEARKAATPGPWAYNENNGAVYGAGVAINPLVLADVLDEDAAAIVAAVNALPELVAKLRAVLALADSLDVDSCDPMPDERARLLYDTADRIRAAVAAAHTEET